MGTGHSGLSCQAPSVYVCICNALTDKDFARATRAGATTVGQAFKALDSTPQCGRCFDCARQVIADTRMEMAQLDMPLAAE